jgi:hypothetical protein
MLSTLRVDIVGACLVHALDRAGADKPRPYERISVPIA